MSNPSASTPGGQARPAHDESAEQECEHPERCGAVTLVRRVKDDGRALILYSHVENEPV
jgi:hypothetical protein